jgi:L,D-transpeptidase catalytic domain
VRPSSRRASRPAGAGPPSLRRMGRYPARPAAREAEAVRPRYDRICAAGGAVAVTLVAGLAGLGVLPAGSSAAAQRPATQTQTKAQTQAQAPSTPTPSAPRSPSGSAGGAYLASKPTDERSSDQRATPPLPSDSGTGRRIVFDMSLQRVWLVGRDGADHDVVRRTYLVSGSLTDNLGPGTYSVYSKSMHAIGVDDSGTMEYMVRFAHGQNAAIGFHDIPVLHGKRVQSRAALGSPASHGCIRQWRPDARALWRFAPVGTEVVVVA